MKISTLQYRGYKARIKNISKNDDISDMVSECSIALPNSSVISVIEAKFTLDSKLIDDGNEVSIEILDEVKNTIYTLQGKATITKRAKAYTEVETWEYSVKDSYDKLFEKVVAEDMTYYDLYFCNTKDKNNSLLHIIARNLGFKDTDLDFKDLTYDNGELIRIPFVYLEENTRWIDNLQGFIDATNGILFVKNKKLIFRPRNLAINSSIILDRTNIITNIEEVRKEVLQNGIKVIYDRYEKLENQVVFNISNKIIVDENTNKDTEVPIMRINYISSSVSQPTITKASGYYFTSDDVNTLTRIDLKKDVHYVIEKLSNTSCEVKFYNPLNYKLYIDNFEIKGIPLVAYEDNEVNVMFPMVIEKNQENFITESKRKLIQTQKQAIFLAKSKMRRHIVNSYEYNFNTYFLPQLEIGSIYQLSLGDFEDIVEIESIDISLKSGNFRMRIKAKGLKNDIGQTKITTKLAGNSNSNYIDLSNIEKKIEENKQELKTVQADIRSKLHKMETTPTENVAENDIWLNPETNVWKKFYNGVWNSISEDEILPSMKMYNSVDTNVIKLQGTADRVGAYLLNDGEKFGSLNGELAHVTFDKLGQFEAINPNNKVALNIKDPANPNRVNSQILLGVTDVNHSKWNNTIFAIGDEASPARIEFKNGQLTQTVNGEELGAKLNNVDKNISNLSKGINDSLNTAKGYADNKKTEIENSFKKEITFEVGGEADKYYPVWFKSTNKLCNLVIYRRFDEKAPDTWNTATHKGSLFLELTTSFGSDWDGNPNAPVVHKFEEYYTTLASKIMIVHRPGILIWLRGGGAIYHAYTNDFETNKNLNVEVLLQGYDNPPWRADYPQTIDGKAGTYAETGSASSIKALYAKEQIKEVDKKITNADGRLTTLQQNYQNTVQDVTNFKTRTADRIDTVQGALDNGNFVVNGNTTFADGVRFVSRGTNEVITIANGTIDFHRDGKKLTRIKNSRYGTIATDSKGKGVVNFDGFKQPMIVLTSIKSANFGKNMASVFCYAEHIKDCQYRMFVGGTNEHYTEAKPIKVVGKEWSTTNAVKTTLLEMTCNFKESGGNYTLQSYSMEEWQYKEFSRKTSKVLKVPKFNVKIVRVDGTAETILYTQDYTVSYYFKGRHDHDSWRGYRESYYKIEPINLTKTFNLLKTYTARTNVKFKLVITILEPNFTIERYFTHSNTTGGRDGGDTSYYSAKYVGTLRTITPADFTGLSITASAETSTLSDVTGTGEVQYIAMEID